MSKVSCNIIRDLMVLYEDHVCSEESRQMVEEHIKECEECHRLFQMSEKELPDISLGKDRREVKSSADELREISRRACKKLERKITYRHILIVSIMLVVAVIASTIWTEWLKYEINVVPSEEIQVTELYELESGDIYCTFKCKDDFIHVNSSGIIVPEGRRLEDCDDGWQEIYFQYSRPFDPPVHELIYGNEISVIFTKTESSRQFQEKNEDGEWIYSGGYTHNCTAVYYGRKDKADKLLVWEEGQEIEPAPEEVENLVRENGLMPGEDSYYGAIIMKFH